MSQAATRYHALYESLRSRRRRSEVPQGLDRYAAQAILKARSRKVTKAWLRSQAQLVGALALYHGRIIEMLTGEGKTLTGSVAAPLLAWRHRHLHVFTVNDYLARRDAISRAGIYKRCLVTVGAIQQEHEPGERFGI